MLWSSIYEISLCIGFIFIIIYGLFSLSTSTLGLGGKTQNRDSRAPREGFPGGTGIAELPGELCYPGRVDIVHPGRVGQLDVHLVNLYINDVYFFSRLWPIMFLLGYTIDVSSDATFNISTQVLLGNGAMEHSTISTGKDFQLENSTYLPWSNGIDLLLILLTIIIMQSFKSFESNLLLLLAFVGQIFMLHSCDLVSFYICLELQNFCFLVLCGLQPRTIIFNMPSGPVNRVTGIAELPGVNRVRKHSPVTLLTGELCYPGPEEPAGSYRAGNQSLFSDKEKSLANRVANNQLLGSSLDGSLSQYKKNKIGIISLTGSRPLAGVEATIKYLLLSAFSSGVLLFWFSTLYLKTGITSLVPPLSQSITTDLWELASQSINFPFLGDILISPKETLFLENSKDINLLFSLRDGTGLTESKTSPWVLCQPGSSLFSEGMPQMLILIALMFKLGGAPLHLWMIDIYGGVKRQLLMYISTAPKLSFFGFWISTWHSIWTDFSLLIFVAFSMLIGSFGAYSQPTLRSLFAYSTVNEIGLMLMAIETAGFHSLLQHLTIYIVTMLLLWNNSDKRFFAILAVSLAGLPPLAGFFGKAWIFNSVATGSFAGPYIGILIISLFCTGLSLVYYLRVFRLFFMGQPERKTHGFSGILSKDHRVSSSTLGVFRKGGFGSLFNNIIIPAGVESNTGVMHNMGIETRTYGYNSLYSSGGLGAGLFFPNVKLTSFCVVFLIFAPLFYIKPFVL